MKYKQPPLFARAFAIAVATTMCASSTWAQSRGLAPNIETGAVASGKGPMASPQDVILAKVRWDQKQGNSLPLDATFKDDKGQTVQLKKYFSGDKPVVLMLIFFNCTMLCSEVMNGGLELFKDQTQDLGFKIGRDFDVVTLSINPRETPELAAGKKKTYLSQLKTQPQAAQGWHMLTGEDAQIKRVADSIGYRYTYNAEMDDYAHPGGIVTITPQGKVARYFPGVGFIGSDVRLGLIEASNNKIGSPMEKLALFTCFHYNPVTGQYTLGLMKVVRTAAIMTILGLGFGIWGMRRVDRKIKSKATGATGVGATPTTST